MVDILTITTIAAVIGAGLNVARGYLGSPVDSTTGKRVFSARLALGGLITGVVGSLALVQTLEIPAGITATGAIILGLVTGFASDYGISKLK